MYDQTRAQQPADRPSGRADRHVPGHEPLVPPGERDEIVRRLGHAVNHFAATPREALEEAESAYDETVDQLMKALAEQRKTLRAGWENRDPETDSTDLRLALRQYREITQRLLRT